MDDISQLKRLAGINEFKGFMKYEPENPLGGSNISLTGTEKAKLMKENNIRPGTPEWFKLWFSLPYMTGERPV
jgi:hypothetical protein